MLLVDAVESQLCPLEIWPTSIQTLIFAFDPHMSFALSQLAKVIAFFFGNGVPLSMACQFFAACSGHPVSLVKRQFSYLYDIWSQPDRKSPIENTPRYYDMREGRFR